MADGIDHLVIAVRDLEAAALELMEAVGLVCTGGGRHEGLGTVNRLAFLADGSYVELIAVEDPDAAGGWPVGVAAIQALDSGVGLAWYALLDDGLPITVALLQAAGSRIGSSVAGGRRRPDGELVRWWTATVEPPDPTVPFLIRHARFGAEWGPAAVSSRRAIPHPAGSPVRLERLDVTVPDPVALAAFHLHELGLEYTRIGPASVCTLGPHAIRLGPAAGGSLAVEVHLRATGPARHVDAFGLTWHVTR